MRKIPVTSSLLVYLDELEYTEAALSAEPEVTEYAKAFQEEIDAWDAMFKREREARRAVTRAEAEVSVLNIRLDEATVRFGGEVLVEAGQDRKSPFFRRFFPMAPSEFIKKSLRSQCEQTLNGILKELESVDTKSRLKRYSAILGTGAKKAIDALDRRAKVKSARSSTGHDVEDWKEGVNQLRLTTYADLLKVAVEKGHSRSWADTFFHAETNSEADTMPAPAPAPAPAPLPKVEVAGPEVVANPAKLVTQ